MYEGVEVLFLNKQWHILILLYNCFMFDLNIKVGLFYELGFMSNQFLTSVERLGLHKLYETNNSIICHIYVHNCNMYVTGVLPFLDWHSQFRKSSVVYSVNTSPDLVYTFVYRYKVFVKNVGDVAVVLRYNYFMRFG
jgi:hypothetical protein